MGLHGYLNWAMLMVFCGWDYLVLLVVWARILQGCAMRCGLRAVDDTGADFGGTSVGDGDDEGGCAEVRGGKREICPTDGVSVWRA
ncbi:hypothetical protein BD779DRAFT_548553 [Infundibulicybe gibba]|nr:hypothetical protein BD779DRAFT_548553 [Infundibulicybe gibba]